MKYDLGIIGGGPAGYSAAVEAVSLGLTVILFEKDEMGGTCLNRGCVPTKFMSHTANLYSQIKSCGKYGICADTSGINFLCLSAKRDEVILQLRNALLQLMRQKKITVVMEKAYLADSGHIETANGTYKAANILIATGSIPMPAFIHGAVNTDELLKMSFIPNSMTIVGGGVIAVEFANIYNALGTEVTICIRGGRILRRWDKELAIGVSQSMKHRGICIKSNCTDHELKNQMADVVLSAAGRIPCLPIISTGLVETGAQGGILVDTIGRTKTEGIFAAGDVIEGSTQLAHVAMEQGKRIANYISGKNVRHISTAIHCIYSHPEAASVGMTEREAVERGMKVLTGKQTMYSNASTLISSTERGFIKLVANQEDRRIIGAQLLCERATDMVGGLALAINQGITVQELCNSTRPHPSFDEAVTEAAERMIKKIG